MNKLLDGMLDQTSLTKTENGAVTRNTTKSKVLDMFAQGAAMRTRSDADIISMVEQAIAEDEVMTLKCLFYIRDIRGGQGERRFAKVAFNHLANYHTAAIRRNMTKIADFGRYDDYYAFVGTKLESSMFEFLKAQFELDMECEVPSLLGKWLKSCNASSSESKKFGNLTRRAFGLTSKEYRQALTSLRAKINVLETLMSANRWDEIEFDKLPSGAGFKYRNAFAARDIIAKKYETFAKDVKTKVNASALYPYEVVEKALDYRLDSVEKDMINKYWANLKDYFDGKEGSMLCVIDTSGSMHGTPINVAISLGLYCAERLSGPFANHYISFASKPQLIETSGKDFVSKVKRIYQTNLIDNTNIEATFDLLLDTATQKKLTQDDLPKSLVIISDMEFDVARQGDYWSRRDRVKPQETLIEEIDTKWRNAGYEMPNLVFWNVDARQNNIPAIGNSKYTYVSGFSPSIFETILSGKTGYELMTEKLMSERYEVIS